MTPLIGAMMLLAYLCGSVSSAVIVSKLFHNSQQHKSATKKHAGRIGKAGKSR